jgi:cytochrome bd ubiquinol oxidase subunit I
LLTYEVLTAFFLEAGFPWGDAVRLEPRRALDCTSSRPAMVALGTLISTFWILASNSWMQTPQGYEIINGQVIPVDWLAVIFNPSFPYRLVAHGHRSLCRDGVLRGRLRGLAPAARA